MEDNTRAEQQDNAITPTPEQHVIKIKRLRQDYNSLLNGFSNYERLVTRCSMMVYDAAENARSWWGKILGLLGNAYPYPDSHKPENNKIEPLADDSDMPLEITEENEISIIKAERVKVSEQLKYLFELFADTRFWTNESTFTFIGLHTSLHNYSIALGLRLGEIKKQQDNH